MGCIWRSAKCLPEPPFFTGDETLRLRPMDSQTETAAVCWGWVRARQGIGVGCRTAGCRVQVRGAGWAFPERFLIEHVHGITAFLSAEPCTPPPPHPHPREKSVPPPPKSAVSAALVQVILRRKMCRMWVWGVGGWGRPALGHEAVAACDTKCGRNAEKWKTNTRNLQP